MLGIQIGILMFLGLPDPDPLVKGTDPDMIWILPFSHKGVERTEIMLANKISLNSRYIMTEDNVTSGKL
jgi:hypothetical protein